MQATDTSANKPKLRIFRKQALFSFVGIIAAIGFYTKFVFDYHLKISLEKYGALLNGAQVNIGSIKTSLISRSVEVERIQVAHHVNAMKNIVEIDNIKLYFQMEPLFRKKLIIYGMTVKGIHHGTQRETSGIRPYDADQTYAPPSLIDRGVSTLYSTIRTDLNRNPLRHLGNLASGLNVKGKIEGLLGELQTVASLNETRANLETAINKWDLRKSDLPSQSQLATLQKKMEELLVQKRNHRSLTSLVTDPVLDDFDKQKLLVLPLATQVETELNAIKQAIQSYEVFVEKDIELLGAKLDIPQLKRDDLTGLVFGTKFMGYLERVSYWIDQSRKKMPTGSTFGHSSIVAQPRDPGLLVHYGKNAGNPSFLIESITFESDLGEDKTLGKVRGVLNNFTLDPPILGKPTTLQLDMDFPFYNTKGIHAELSVDHLGSVPLEEFKLHIENFQLSDWMISEQQDLKFKVDKARCSVDFTGKFEDQKVMMDWNFRFKDVSYDVQSRFKQVQEVLRNVLTGIYSFDVAGNVSGTFSELKYEASSEFGKQLAAGLQREFRHQISALEETLRGNITDQTAPRKRAILDRLQENEQNVFEPYFAARRSIQSLQDLADKIAK